MKQQEKAPQARGECHTHCPKEELGEYRSSKHCEQQMTTGTSAGALSVASVVEIVTQLRVGPPALIRPAFALYPALPSSLRSVPRPPASPQKLPLARPSRGSAPSRYAPVSVPPAHLAWAAKSRRNRGGAIEQPEAASLSWDPTALWDGGGFLWPRQVFRVPFPPSATPASLVKYGS